MPSVTASGRDDSPELDRSTRGLAWLRRDEGWAPGEGAGRLALAIIVALGAVSLKLVVVRGFGGELGYLSYVGAVVLGAWIAGLRGGLITTTLCALAEVLVFDESLSASATITPLELFGVGLFLFVGILVSVITSGLYRATYRERQANVERIDVQARLTRIAGDERRQAAELRAVIQAMGEGILVVDPTGRISLANDAAAEILGELPTDLADLAAQLGDVGLESVGGRDGKDRVDPADAGTRTAALPDGRWVEITKYPADLGGRLIEGAAPSMIVVIRDVTRVRDAEAAREAFLGVLSHELRTPVTTIFGYAKVLQRASRREDRDEMLADIEVEADRLYRIVEDLLALSRVEGGITIEGEPLLVQHLAEPVVASEAQRWNQVTFETNLPAGLPAVFGERTYVEQVLRNMVSNAGKYSPPDTVVTVAATATPTEVLVQVLDRGAGIRPDEADRLFDLYYRSPATARTAAGAGIGLYVGRGLISAMGGRIWARPRDGGGSEFGFSLLRCDEDAVSSADFPDASDAAAVSASSERSSSEALS